MTNEQTVNILLQVIARGRSRRRSAKGGRRLKQRLALAAISAGLLAWGPARAQTTAPAATPPATAPPTSPAAASPQDIVVTGTRISRRELGFANPVVSITSKAIELSGRTNLADLLQQSPALLGSTTGSLTAGSNTNFGETGLNLLNLRNLGTNRTLVLVDGRRHVAGLAGSAAVDIDAIPTDLVDAVDVLTGGASAIYGADGVSGVVNFRLKYNFEGLEARFQNGISQRGDNGNRFGAITVGKNFAGGRGNVALAYEYDAEDRVSDQARRRNRNPYGGDLLQNQNDLDDDPNVPDNVPYYDVRYSDSSFNGAVDIDGDGVPDYVGTGRRYDRGQVLEGSGGYAVGGSSTPTDGYQGDLAPRIRRHLVDMLTHFDFSDALTIFAEGKYVRSQALSLSQPTYDFYLPVSAENPFMPQSIRDAIVPGAAAAYLDDPSVADDTALITRDNFDLGINTEQDTRQTLRGVIGAKGRITDHARYELSYVYGQTRTRIVSQNNRVTDKWLAAVDVVTDPATSQPVCRSSLDPDADPRLAGCLPYDVFGAHQQDPAAIAFVTENSVSHSKVSQQVISGSVSGDFGALFSLPGGPIGFAIGGEYRRERSNFVPDPDIADGLTWLGAEAPSAGGFTVKETFAELNAPLLKDVRFAKLLSFGAALRFSDYSTIGRTTTWKVDGVYAPGGDVSFRGTFSQAVRAPNIGELFAPQSYASNFITDPCDTRELNNGSTYRAANCAAVLTALGVNPSTFSPSSNPISSVYTDGLSSGNPNLREETAKTWTAGIVLRPSFLRGFTASADWYDIRIGNAINIPQAQDLAQLCVDQPSIQNSFCPNITRDPKTGYIKGFVSQPENVANFRTAGLDLTLGYHLKTARIGTFDLSLVGNYLNKLSFVASPGAAPISSRGLAEFVGQPVDTEPFGGAPKYSATFDLTWQQGGLTINYGINWFSRTHRYSYEQTAGDPDYAAKRYLLIKDKWEHELQLSYDIEKRFTVYGGVNNLFDQKPAFGYEDYPVSGIGRYLYVGAKVMTDKLF